MNMGGPGDHWLTDLKNWNLPAFGEPMDGILRDILDRYTADLARVRDRLRADAVARGWEVSGD